MPRTTSRRSTAASAICGSSRPTSVDGVADAGAEQPGGGLAEQHAGGVVGSQVAALDDLVDALGLGLHAVAEEGDERVGLASVHGGAEHGAGRRDPGLGPDARAPRRTAPAIDASVSNGRVPLGVSRIW